MSIIFNLPDIQIISERKNKAIIIRNIVENSNKYSILIQSYNIYFIEELYYFYFFYFNFNI